MPDRFRQSTREVDLGDFGAALLADARFRLRVALAVGGVGAGVGCGFDERPAQVPRPLLAQWPAQVTLAGLVDAWAEAAVPGQLAWVGKRVMSPISAAIV